MQPAYKKLKYKTKKLPQTEKQAKEIITLPIHQYLKRREIIKICKVINKFYENK